MKYIVYKTTNKINGKFYIGFHKCNPDSKKDSYLGSGKLIKQAIQKYGRHNFTRETLFVYGTPKEALNKERELVNDEFVKLTNNYNLSIGGGACILFGESNGFYGKKHTAKTIQKMQLKFRNFIEANGFLRTTEWACVVDNRLFSNKAMLANHYNLHINNMRSILTIVLNNGYFIDRDFNKTAEEILKNIILKAEENKIKKSIEVSKRFKNVPKSQETKDKIRESHKGKVHSWQDKINKNPDKIEKTRQKHIGMKRSDLAVDNIRKGQLLYTTSDDYINPNKNKICYHDPDTKQIGFFVKGEQPLTWIKGNPSTSKKCYYDPITLVCKRFSINDVPEGWINGNPKLKNKNL